jgi:PAS domain S-box-containing protein
VTDTPTLLVVDDTTESLALLTAILTSAGFDVHPADSGERALAAVDGDRPDLILLAIRMKGMDGFEVCRRLRANENTRSIPIIFIGASADTADRATGLRLGAADYITRPFQPEQLLARVRTHLALSRADVTLEQQAAALSRTNEELRSEIAVRLSVEARLRESLDRAERSRRAMLSALEDQKRAQEEAVARARQQAAISELGGFALTDPEFLVLADRATRRVAEVLDVELCKVLEIQPDRSALLRAGVGWQEGLVGRGTVGLGQDSQAGFTLDSKEPVIVEDLRTETRFRGPQLLHDHQVISGVSVVIGDPERPYGVLGAHTTRRREFTVHDVHFLQGVAHLLAAAVKRQQSQAAMGESERRLADTIDAARLGAFDWDLVTGRIVWNARQAELFGIAIEEFNGTFDGLVQRVHPDDRVVLEQAVARSRRERSAFTDEFRVVWPDASVHWIAVNGRPSHDGRTAQLVRVRGVVWDITERKNAEARMSEQLNELRRWHQAMLGREGRLLELKKEINDLLAQSGKPPRYPGAAGA